MIKLPEAFPCVEYQIKAITVKSVYILLNRSTDASSWAYCQVVQHSQNSHSYVPVRNQCQKIENINYKEFSSLDRRFWLIDFVIKQCILLAHNFVPLGTQMAIQPLYIMFTIIVSTECMQEWLSKYFGTWLSTGCEAACIGRCILMEILCIVAWQQRTTGSWH